MVESAVAELIKSSRLPDHIRQLQDYLDEEQERRKAFHANLPEGRKVEFINGEVVESMPVRKSHTDVIKLLLRLLDEFVSLRSLGYVGFEKCLISLDRNDYEPDICFWGSDKSDEFTKHQMQFPAPDFIAEALSPSTEGIDRGDKFRDYAANGVREYWIIDPDGQSVEQYVLVGNGYTLRVKLRIGVIASEVVTGFEIPVRALFDADENRTILRKIING
jgi:Uma2 family endonuclease